MPARRATSQQNSREPLSPDEQERVLELYERRVLEAAMHPAGKEDPISRLGWVMVYEELGLNYARHRWTIKEDEDFREKTALLKDLTDDLIEGSLQALALSGRKEALAAICKHLDLLQRRQKIHVRHEHQLIEADSSTRHLSDKAAERRNTGLAAISEDNARATALRITQIIDVNAEPGKTTHDHPQGDTSA